MAAPMAAGGYRACVEAARALLAGSATWRSVCGAADAAAALPFIARDVDADVVVPGARVVLSRDVRDEGALTRIERGTVRWIFMLSAPEAYGAAEDGEAWALNVAGQMADEMSVLADGGGYLWLREARVTEEGRPSRPEKGEVTLGARGWRVTVEGRFGPD